MRLSVMVGLMLVLSLPRVAVAAPVLARVDGPPAALIATLPVHAALQDAGGREYVLALADEAVFPKVGRPYQVLGVDPDLTRLVLARSRRPGWESLPVPGRVLMRDGRHLLLAADAEERAELAGLGFELRALPEQPMVNGAFPDRVAAAVRAAAVTYDPRVAELMALVSATGLHQLVSALSGVAPAVTGGDLYTVRTRYTTNQVATQKATHYALQHLQGLGLPASYHHWNFSSYSNRNVVATLPGGALSNELVLVVAHLDSTAPAPRAVAPGADDNASGSAAVLTAAGLMSRYRFNRTVRFVLFTGEEQGLYGSQRYATLVSGAGENVVAVFNMDMIAWDATGGPTLRLHTRTSGSAGYPADLALAQTFTNVVATYGLGASLTPIITADGEAASDHSSFWDVGYPGLLAIEDDYDDFHTYYHTTNDTLARLNFNYFTAFTKAALGTVAHLAQPVRTVPFDVIQVDNSTWVTGSAVGVGTLYARHEEGALENGADTRDVAWSAMPTNPYGRWLRVHTAPDGLPLATDARPTNSSSLFVGQLTAITTGAAPFSCTNRLRFSALSALDSNRAYDVRVRVDARYAATSNAFLWVTNLPRLLSEGGYVGLPLLTNLTNGAVYGTVEIGARLAETDASRWPLGAPSHAGSGLAFTLPVPAGFTVVDTVEGNSNLAQEVWLAVQVVTTRTPVVDANFESGWDTVSLGPLAFPAGRSNQHYRVRRQWRATP